MENKPNFFEKKIKPILKYVGTIGAIIMCVVYILIVCLMVFGFSANQDLTGSVIFALVNAVVGLIIMQFLKVQGIDFAKDIPENEELLKKYNNEKIKGRKPHSITHYWIASIIKDIFSKVLGILITSFGIIYIIIIGSKDYSLLFLALVNLLMFICFGLLSLISAYDYFNNEHMFFIKEKLNEGKTKEDVDLAKKKHNKQKHDNICCGSRDHILDACVDTSHISVNSEPMVVDSDECRNIVLDGTIHTSDSTTDCADTCAQENT